MLSNIYKNKHLVKKMIDYKANIKKLHCNSYDYIPTYHVSKPFKYILWI